MSAGNALIGWLIWVAIILVVARVLGGRATLGEAQFDEAWVSRHELLDAGYTLSRPDGSPIDPAGARVYHVIARPGTR